MDCRRRVQTIQPHFGQNRAMLLADVVAASEAVGATRSRKAKIAALAEALGTAGPDEVETATSYLSGVLRQRRTGLGWRGLTSLPEPAGASTLTVNEVHDSFEAISRLSGSGSQGARGGLVAELFGRATENEQRYLRNLVTGELRQGALDGLMLEAIAAAADVSAALVRRAAMLCGATVPVAVAALTDGEPGLGRFGLEVGRPLRPMLASTAPDVDAALEKMPDSAEFAVDRKLDGIRIQVHKSGDHITVYTRTLDEITDRLPEVVEAVRPLPVRDLVLDGEAIALDESGAPRPFQVTAARTASKTDPAVARTRTPVTTYFFDILHADGADLIDEPARHRFDVLTTVLPAELVVPRLVTGKDEEARQYFTDAVAAGHEGVVVKSLDAAYEAGRRGAAWVKVKPRHTLDLVVLAVEWGNGRRQGWLSNIHLGARDPETGGFVMLGKTFKGMTDEMLAWQTERFLELESSRSSYVVQLRPEQVVEIAFDGIQSSSRYPGGMALRFARVLRYRDDKTAAEADTVDTVRSLKG